MHAWKRLLRPDDLFIDVGANVGAYSLWAASLGAGVIAVEPDPATAELLRENIGLNSFDIEVLQAAATNRPGVVRLTEGLDAMNHLDDSGDLEVRAITIDSLLGNRRARGIKVDVEGAERLVIEGARAALSERRIDFMQLEWNSASEVRFGETRQPLRELLTAMGYRLYRPDITGRLVPIDDDSYGPDVFAASEAARIP